MSFEQFLGLGFLVLGLVSTSSYVEDLSPLRLNYFYKELRPMQERWGSTPGLVLHILGYTIAPLAFGLIFLTGMVVFH